MKKTKKMVSFTKYTSSFYPLSKKYKLTNNGIEKSASATMHKGIAERVIMPFEDFGKALSMATSNQAFGSHRYTHLIIRASKIFKFMTKSPKHSDPVCTAFGLGRVCGKSLSRFQRNDEVPHALQTNPHRLGAWRPIVFTSEITAQAGYQANQLAQAGRFLWW